MSRFQVDLGLRTATSLLVLSLVSSICTADAAAFKVLHSFAGAPDDGSIPAALATDAAGNLYGTTFYGGSGCSSPGCGVVYKIAPDGSETVLYNFQGGTDGGEPFGRALALDGAGNLYGTTTGGGGYAHGTVYKLSPNGVETVLYAFAGGLDGWDPESAVVEDTAGNLYGTTVLGGDLSCGADGCGTVFKLAPDGTKTTLYAFQGGNDGWGPWEVALDSSGNLFGTTELGGDSGCDGSGFGCGTVFKVAPDGTETILYAFTGGNDGAYPGGIVLNNSGAIFGTAASGGSHYCEDFGRQDPCGTVFKLSQDGTLTPLHDFDGNDGAFPNGNIILDEAGNVYGTTGAGGGNSCRKASGCGVVFKLGYSGAETVLHFFGSGKEAHYPGGLLRQGRDLYGTSQAGGPDKDGTVFRLKK